MAGLLDWLSDTGIFGGGPTGGTPMQPGPGGIMGDVNPMGDPTGGSSPLPTPAPAPTRAMPPVQQLGADAPPIDPYSQGNPTAGFGGASVQPDPAADGNPASGFVGAQPQPPVPMPQPRPAGASGAMPMVPPGQSPGDAKPTVPGPPMQLGPGLGVGASPPPAPGGTFLSRALGISPEQSQQMGAGLASGLKSVGENWNKPGLAAFSGSAGSAMEGSQRQQAVQSKQMTDALNAAIKAKSAGDEAGYKQNYLKYLAAKLQADTEKAASKDAGANKNDTPTQLYLNAQRLVQSDPEVRDASKALSEARKNGTPEEVAKAQAAMQQIIQAKQAQHFSALGLNPQTAAQLAKQPGMSQQNPVDAGALGITKDNIAKKLQPGQYFRNPADGKVYQYKGPAASGGAKKPTASATPPEPVDPMKPYKTPAEGDNGED